MAEREEAAEKVEALSAELHAIYQREARRQAGTGDDEVRHPDDYDALPEHTKEYDRVLARFILAREAASEARYREAVRLLEDISGAMSLGSVRRGVTYMQDVAQADWVFGTLDEIRRYLDAIGESGDA